MRVARIRPRLLVGLLPLLLRALPARARLRSRRHQHLTLAASVAFILGILLFYKLCSLLDVKYVDEIPREVVRHVLSRRSTVNS